MENPASENSYEEAKKKAKEFYGKIGHVWCPALGDFVVFNQAGFEHLVQKRGSPRPKSEQKRRFSLLPYVKNILEDQGITIIHEKNKILHSAKVGGARVIMVTTAQFWRIVALRDDEIIKIIIRQIDGHEKHFFSIFAKKQKSTR